LLWLQNGFKMGQTASSSLADSIGRGINGDVSGDAKDITRNRPTSAAYEPLPVVYGDTSERGTVKLDYDILQDKQLILNLQPYGGSGSSSSPASIDDTMRARLAVANKILELVSHEVRDYVDQLITDKKLDKLPCKEQGYTLYAIYAVTKDGKYVDNVNITNFSPKNVDFYSDCLLKYVTRDQAVLKELLQSQYYTHKYSTFLTVRDKQLRSGLCLEAGYRCGDYTVYGVYYNFHACCGPCPLKIDREALLKQQELERELQQQSQLRLQQIKLELVTAVTTTTANNNFKLQYEFQCSSEREAYYIVDAINTSGSLKDVSEHFKATNYCGRHQSPKVIVYFK